LDRVAKHERIAAVILTVLGLIVAVYSLFSLRLGTIFSPEAGFVPFLVGLVLVIFALLWLFAAKGRQEDSGPFWAKGAWQKPTLSFVAIIYYAMTFQRLGYITSTVTFALIWQLAIERTGLIKALLFSLLSAAGMYLLFGILLKVPIPPEIFMR